MQDPWEKNLPGLGLGRDPERTSMQEVVLSTLAGAEGARVGGTLELRGDEGLIVRLG